MKKKLFVIVALCFAVLCFVGCEMAKEIEEVNEVIDNDVVENVDVIEDTVEIVDEDVEDDSAEDSNSEYTRGNINDDVYESEWIGLRFEADEDMTFATEEEVLQAMGLGMEMLEIEEETSENMLDYANMASVYEMLASDIYGNNVILMTEKLMIAGFSTAQYIDALKYQLEELTGKNFDFSEITTVEIGGKEFQRITFTYNVYGLDVNQEYNVMKKGDRMISIILTKASDDADRFYDGFFAY